MSAQPTPIRILPDGTRLGGLTLVAEVLGVRTSQVDAWVRRRAASGFPKPIARGPVAGHGEVDLYDIDDARAWHLMRPRARPGRPRARVTNANRGNASAVARALGLSPKRVHKWVERRASNGCPEPGADGLYDVDEWRSWAAPRLADESTGEAA